MSQINFPKGFNKLVYGLYYVDKELYSGYFCTEIPDDGIHVRNNCAKLLHNGVITGRKIFKCLDKTS